MEYKMSTPLHHHIERLINFAIQQELIESTDVIYIRNQYLELFNLEYQPNTIQVTEKLKYPDEILTAILNTLSPSSKSTTSSPQLLEHLGKNADGGIRST